MPAQILEQPSRMLSTRVLERANETAAAKAATMPAFYIPGEATAWAEKPYEWEISRLPLGMIALAAVAFWAALGCAAWLL